MSGIIVNVFMMGIQRSMVPPVALTAAIPYLADRGAFLSINSSL